MDEGCGKEYNHPYALLVNDLENDSVITNDGFFAQMVKATGKETAKALFQIAQDNYRGKYRN